jgi:hypothetical protein
VHPEERLIASVLARAGVASGRRRREIELELRAHVEEIVEEARAEGRSDSDISALIVRRFGSPEPIAAAFADVYRIDRWAIVAVSFIALTIAATALAYGLVYVVEQALASAFGSTSARAALSLNHLAWQGVLMVGLTAGYLGLYFGERVIFRGRPFAATALVGLPMLAAAAPLEAWARGAGYLLLASFASAVAVRALHRLAPRWGVRILAGAGLFVVLVGVAPLVVGGRAPAHVFAVVLPTCAAIAASCQLTARLAAAFERRLLRFAPGSRV